MADNNREDVTHVKIENISFNDFVIIYTEGLVTLYGCTIHWWIRFFMHKSQHEPDVTYKTAEMIPSVINNKTINIINTSVHGDLEMYLLSGIRTINIIRSDFILSFLEVVAGNKSVDTVNSRHLVVLNISIINTTFTEGRTDYWAYGRDSIISMQTTHSTFTKSRIYQYKGAGYFGAVIEDTKFHRSQVLFKQVISVSMRNCEYEVSDIIYFDIIKISGIEHLYGEPEGIRKTIKQLIGHSSHFTILLSIEDTVFTGTLHKQTDSVIKTEGVTPFMSNVNFDIDQKGVNRKRWYISYTVHWGLMPVKLINVTINATSLPSASPIAVISSDKVDMENFEIFCPQGLAVAHVSSKSEEQISCEKQCPTDAYTFQAGSAVINGNKDSFYSQYNIKYNRSEVHCKVCPLGANCTGPINALPNYWGYKDSKDDSVTMIRCPDGYCCKGNDTCDGINSCNINRTGNICGKCQKGLSEVLFSTECLSADSCVGAIALLYYTICVIIYVAFLASYKDLQKYAATKIKDLYKRIKDQVCLYWKKNDSTNSDEHNEKPDEEIEVDIKNEKRDTDTQRRKEKSENDGSQDKNQVKDNKSDDSTKYIQILFFYIQDALLFKINIPGQNYQEKGTIEKILSFSPKILTVTYSKVIHTCFSYAETPVSKILFEMFFGIYLIFIIWLLYLILKLISKFLKKTSNIWAKLKSCLLRAFLLGMLFSYQNLVMGAFTLVRCVDIANIKVLHIEGDVQCYNWWQYLVMCYIIFFIIPVFLVLSHFPHYIKDKYMSVKTFILSCLVPAPVMMYYVIKELRRKIHLLYRAKFLTETIPIEMLEPENKTCDTQVNFDAYVGPKDLDIPFIDEDSNGDKHSDSTSHESSIAASSNERKENVAQISVDLPIMHVKTVSYSKSEIEILTALLEHYRELNLFGVRFTWLCIHKLYRIVLVCCNTFITEPIYRLCLMTLVLIIVTVVNSIVKPYNDYKANLTASFSYAANLCLAVLNIVRSVMITFDCKSNCSFQGSVLWYFDLTENVLLSYIPCVVIAAWFMFFMVQKYGPKNKKD